MATIIVLKDIEMYGRTIAAGRPILTSTPEKIIEKYGKNVAVWDNWPAPYQPKETSIKSKKKNIDPSPPDESEIIDQ